jgi:hypothetical protein
MSKRKAISKKVRFEVFKRDAFTCQYCGKAAPDVILHVDHIEPVSKGGGNDILNLITSCADCNGGKGATKLDDQAAVAKQRAQLQELSARREQLRMMLDWRKGMKSIEDMSLEAARDHFAAAFEGWEISSDSAIGKLREHIRKFGVQAVMDAMDIARDRYVSTLTPESVGEAWSKVGGICHNRANPEEMRLKYVRGILRNRLYYLNERTAMDILREALTAGVDLEEMEEVAKKARSWTDWRNWMREVIDEVRDA